MKQALTAIKATFNKYDPRDIFEYQFADQEYAKKFGNEERIGKLSGFFAILAIFISCLGLFGMASFMAEQRIKEIGVRKVLGASVQNITTMLSKDFLKYVLIATLIAWPLAWFAVNRWLQDYAYRVNISWGIFVLAAVSAIVIALLTISFQAIKAAVANPVKSLRTE